MAKENTLLRVKNFLKENQDILTSEALEEIIKDLEIVRQDFREKEREKIKEAQRKKRKNKKGSVLYIKPATRRIAMNEYRGNKDIVKVVLNIELKEIDEFAFADCPNLVEVVFQSKNVILRRGCFKNCDSLKNITIPNSSCIFPSAFEGCCSLERVVIPSSVTNIYTNAFKDCYSLRSVIFEEKGMFKFGTTHLFSGSFENCTSLKKLKLYNPNIDAKAFVNCTNLKEIEIHSIWKRNLKLKKCEATIVWK